MTKDTKPKWICGFWRRLIAFMIDVIIIGAFGLCLGLLFKDTFVEIGPWGRLVGFFIALVYFGLLNSEFFGGQTLGKKLLKIKVVDPNNKLIRPVKSVIRCSILAIPFLLNGAQFSDAILFSFAIYIISIVVFGGTFSLFYLYLFNRATRQSLHDIIAKTYVVNANIEPQETNSVWKLHYGVVVALFVASAIVPYFTTRMAEQEPFANLMSSRTALMENPLVSNAGISFGTSTFSPVSSEAIKTQYVNTQINLKKNETSNEELAENFAKLVIKHYPESLVADVININLIYGYDIGIASQWESHGYQFNPKELTQAE